MAIRRKGFWKPIIMDGDGFYVTQGQLDSFLLRRRGYKKIMKYFNSISDDESHGEFSEYIETCKIYNVINDATKADPEASKMYWDTDEQSMKFTYPEGGAIDMMIRSMIGHEEDMDFI